MKKLLFALALPLTATAFAGTTTNIKDPNCSDMAKVKETVTPAYLAVIDGYDKSGRKISEEIDMGEIVSDSKKANEECMKNKSAKISAARKGATSMPTSPKTATKLDPVKAKCESFIALSEEVQPVAVFWVAGHTKEGKLKKGQVEEEFLERPIATLVEDCRANPTASFYDKTKAWVKKKI